MVSQREKDFNRSIAWEGGDKMRLLIEKDDGELVPVKEIESVSPDSSVLLLHSVNYLRKDDMEGIEKIMSEKTGKTCVVLPIGIDKVFGA